MLRFSRYVGSKLHFYDTFDRLSTKLGCTKYVEPFFGSGAVFFNETTKFDKYVINDSNPHIINTVNAFKNGTYERYAQIWKKVCDEFGDIKESKESYYKMRDWSNENYFGGKGDRIDEGFLFHFLMNSCINSMVRIGPNGMNQSWGNRMYLLTEHDYSAVSSILNNRTLEINCDDYEAIILKHDSPDTLMFLDPPYFSRPTVGYKDTIDKQYELDRFLNLILNLKSKVIYTDISNDAHSSVLSGWNSIATKELKSVSPNRKDDDLSSMETAYFNFNARIGATPLF